jgi:hypothetical protein
VARDEATAPADLKSAMLAARASAIVDLRSRASIAIARVDIGQITDRARDIAHSRRRFGAFCLKRIAR